MNRRVIAFLLGHILLLEAAFMLPALLISVFLSEEETVMAFAWSILLTAAAGFLFTRIRPASTIFCS